VTLSSEKRVSWQVNRRRVRIVSRSVGATGLAEVLRFSPIGPFEIQSGAACLRPVDRSPDHPAAERQEFERAEIVRILAGETDRYEYFVRTYQKRIYRLTYMLLRDPAEADGLTQDVFVKAYRGLAEFKGDAAFETWVTRIAINGVRDVVRRRRPVVSFSDLRGAGEEDGPELPDRLDPADGTSPERDLMSREIRRRIADALVALSPRQRTVFVMKHYEERSIAEIGAATGLDEGTIKSHLFRAARKLRQRLEDLR
jgi:RNA polymerase sigma-70 factor (ECF subfamily)